MRILFFITNLKCGGAEKKVLTLSHNLKEIGHTCKIVTINDVVQFDALIRKYQLSFHTLSNKKRFYFLFSFLFFSIKFRKICNRFNPDIIHAFSIHCFIIARIAGVSPLCYGIENTAPFFWKNKHLRVLPIRLLEKWAFSKKKNCYIAVSFEALKSYQQRFKFISKNTSVIPNGLELSDFKINRKPDQNSTDVNIFVIGSLIQIKNFSMAILGIRALHQKGITGKLFIIGNGPQKEYLQTVIIKNGVENHVKFLGFRDDVPDLLSTAHFLWVTSESEGFGIVIIEAFMSRTPVIATNVPGIREIVNHNQNGLLVELNDHDELAEKTTVLIKDKKLKEEMIANAYEDANSKYNIKDIAKAHIQEYMRFCNIIGNNIKTGEV